MAQYYQLIGQGDQPIQAVTIEELRQYYPNITCVINQDDTTSQFQSQQVILAAEQQIVLNSGQTYIKQENQIVEYQKPGEVAQTSGQPRQVFYTTGNAIKQQTEQSPQLMQQQQVQLVNHIIQGQNPMVNHQIIAPNQRVITQHVITEQVGHMLPQQINNTSVIQQRRVSVNVQTTPPRSQNQQVYQPDTPGLNESENQLVQTSDGRVMTLGQLKDELSLSKKNQTSQLTTNPVTPVKKPKAPAKPRNSTPRSRGNAGNKSRSGGQNKRSRAQNILAQSRSKQLPPGQSSIQKPVIQYVNKNAQTGPPYQPNQILHQQLSQPMTNQQHQITTNQQQNQPQNQFQHQQQAQILHNQSNQQQNRFNHQQSAQPGQINQPQQQNQFKQHQQSQQQPGQINQPQQQNQFKPSQPNQQQNQFNQQQNQFKQQTQSAQNPLVQQALQQRLLQQQMQQNIRLIHSNALPQQKQQLPHQQQMVQPQIPQQRNVSQNQQQMIHPQQIQQCVNQPKQIKTNPPNRQAPIPLLPVYNGGHKQGYSPTNQMIEDSCSSSVSDEYKDSAKMLVCLENGEQRLITFTIPKESCTVQDLLEQVGVPFDASTNIECVTNTGIGDIDYIVNVGTVTPQPFIESQQVLTVDNLSESQECIVSQSGAVIPVTEPQPQQQQSSQPTSEEPKSPEKPTEPTKEAPKIVPGYLALCSHCGYLSEDFNRCQRCRTKMPDEPKAVATTNNVLKQQTAQNKKIDISKTKLPPLIPSRLTPKQNNAKAPGKGRKSKKMVEAEPVILTLSSDDEESPSKTMEAITNQLEKRVTDSAIVQSVMEKEPKYLGGYPVIDSEEFNINSRNNSTEKEISLTCRTIRIGTHKFVPREDVKMTKLGLTVEAPIPSDQTKWETLFIPSKAIVRVLVNFHKALPALFYYLAPSAGVIIRQKLQMQQGSEIYFDPVSRQEPLKRLTLLPDIIEDDLKTEIIDLYANIFDKYSLLCELDTREANEILIKSCPKDQKRDSICDNPTVPQQLKVTNSDTNQMLIFPPPPAKGGITINLEDYKCLEQDQFLNDAIIDFYLKYLQIECLDKDMQDRVHIFSSFFYKRLTTKPVKATKKLNLFETDASLTPAQKRHCRVKKWTKNVNIFEKDFIIIPINENSHWFLAIICYPGLDQCRLFNDNNIIVQLPPKEKNKKHCKTEKTSLVIGNTTITLETRKTLTKSGGIDKPIKCDDEDLSDRDEAEGDESELEETESEPEVEEPVVKTYKNHREPIKQPCILIFDSLAGAGRSRVVATLRDYLTCEHRTKLNSTKTFTKDNIKGACPKVPQQMNFTDCGLYVLQYAEAFFKRPISDYHIPIKELKDWFEEIEVTRKREDITLLIKKLMTDKGRDISSIPALTLPTLNGKLITRNSQQEIEAQVTDEEEAESETMATTQSSLVSDAYNSEESDDNKRIDVNMSNSDVSTVVTNINTLFKPDNDVQKKSNRETMSYLKSKRIIRHKNNDSFENKKQKLE